MIGQTQNIEIRPYGLDDDLIEAVQSERTSQLRVSTPMEVAVVVGKGSKLDLELNIEAIQRDDIPVYLRHGGGCSVLLDSGNVVVSLVLPTNGIANNQRYFDKISTWLIESMKQVGITGIYQDGVSDLVKDNRKVGGSSIYRTNNYLYYSTTILINPMIELMDRYLKHPPREPEYRQERKHSDFVGRIDIAHLYTTIDNFKDKLTYVCSTQPFETLLNN